MKRYFFTGLVILLPAAVTTWVLLFLIHFLTKPFLGVMTALLSHWNLTERSMHLLSVLLILVGLVLFTFLLGAVARHFFFRSMIRLGDRILEKIPLVNKIYKTSKEIIRSLFASTGPSFQQAVLISFPYPGSYCIGLITKDAPKTCDEAAQETMVTVFIPTTPNPTTGYLTMAPKKELIHLSMSAEEAIKYIVSCGVVQPRDQP
jgi:uncharacterized membrane protein